MERHDHMFDGDFPLTLTLTLTLGIQDKTTHIINPGREYPGVTAANFDRTVQINIHTIDLHGRGTMVAR